MNNHAEKRLFLSERRLPVASFWLAMEWAELKGKSNGMVGFKTDLRLCQVSLPISPGWRRI